MSFGFPFADEADDELSWGMLAVLRRVVPFIVECVKIILAAAVVVRCASHPGLEFEGSAVHPLPNALCLFVCRSQPKGRALRKFAEELPRRLIGDDSELTGERGTSLPGALPGHAFVVNAIPLAVERLRIGRNSHRRLPRGRLLCGSERQSCEQREAER